MIDIRTVEKNDHTILAVKFSGKLTKEERDGFNSEFESKANQYPQIRLFLDLTELLGWNSYSGWKDFSLTSNETEFLRIAIVGPLRRTVWMKRACTPLTWSRSKKFSTKREEAAWEWLVH